VRGRRARLAADPPAKATTEPHPAISGSLKETPWPVGKRGKVGGWWDHYKDSNDVTYDDFSAFMSYKQVYGQVWSGNYTDGVELGGYVRDRRKSTYGGFYRWRDGQDHVVQFDTAQVLSHGLVWVADPRHPCHPDDAEGPEPGSSRPASTGITATTTSAPSAISDPREGGRWTFQFSHRFYRGEWFYLEPAILPRTDGTMNWFLKGKVKYFVWLVGDFSQFDFSDIERNS
jgi:hypothetical protein